MGHGGKRDGSGRKSKAEEQQLIERLTPLAPVALEALKAGIENKEFPYIKLFMEYFYGKPQDKIDITSGGEIICIRFKDAE